MIEQHECMHACKYDIFHIYTLKPQSLSVVASVHYFSGEGLHFSALVAMVAIAGSNLYCPVQEFHDKN